MPRKPRFFLPDLPVHVVQRGHSREPVFFEDSDYRAYLDWLTEAARRYHCAIHAYVLMTNHVHLLTTPAKRESVSRMMQYVGRRYVPYINHTYGTSGSKKGTEGLNFQQSHSARQMRAGILARLMKVRNGNPGKLCLPSRYATSGCDFRNCSLKTFQNITIRSIRGANGLPGTHTCNCC